MNRFTKILFSIISTFASFITTGTANDGILTLDQSNFQSVIDSSDLVLVKFYAPWCMHCKNLHVEYVKAAKILADQHVAVKMAQVDATTETSLAHQHEIMGYPTVKLFKQGRIITYNGGRTANEIVTWVLRHQ